MNKRWILVVFMMLALFTSGSVKSQNSNKQESLDKPKSGSLTPPIRRVVTGTNAAGKSTVISDGLPPNIIHRPRGAGGEFALFWFTNSTPADNTGNKDATLGQIATTPPANGSSFHMVEWEPGEGLTNDPADAKSESAREPGMHQTKTIDYVVILSGAINMRMEDASEVQLKAGDVLVQRGVYHKWVNRGKEPCRAAMIQIPSIAFKE